MVHEVHYQQINGFLLVKPLPPGVSLCVSVCILCVCVHTWSCVHMCVCIQLCAFACVCVCVTFRWAALWLSYSLDKTSFPKSAVPVAANQPQWSSCLSSPSTGANITVAFYLCAGDSILGAPACAAGALIYRGISPLSVLLFRRDFWKLLKWPRQGQKGPFSAMKGITWSLEAVATLWEIP